MIFLPSKAFGSKYNLREHVAVVHEKEIRSKNVTGIDVTCDLCKKKFTSKSSLNRHTMYVHEGVKCSCEFCGKTFLTPQGLKFHVKNIHEGVKYKCDLCNNLFTHPSTLKSHINIGELYYLNCQKLNGC